MIPAKKKLFGPAHTPLEVIGQFQGNLEYHGRESKQIVYVVKDLKTNLQSNVSYPDFRYPEMSVNPIASFREKNCGNM